MFLVFMVIPVYEIAGFLDIVFCNLLEFWTGRNPVVMNEGEKDTRQMAINGTNYRVTAERNKFTVEKEHKNRYELSAVYVYKTGDSSWYRVEGNKEIRVAHFTNEGSAAFYSNDGKTMTIQAERTSNGYACTFPTLNKKG
jgi:hypothetical protein